MGAFFETTTFFGIALGKKCKTKNRIINLNYMIAPTTPHHKQQLSICNLIYQPRDSGSCKGFRF